MSSLYKKLTSFNMKKVGIDTVSGNVYGIVVGVAIDYFGGGLTGWGIVGARTSALGTNSLTLGPYGYWQDRWYEWLRVTPEQKKFKEIINKNYNTKKQLQEIVQYSGRSTKKFAADMITFNTFQPLLYATSNIVGQLIDSGFDFQGLDYESMWEGMKFTAMISPGVAPTLKWTMQLARKLVGEKTSAEKAETKLKA